MRVVFVHGACVQGRVVVVAPDRRTAGRSGASPARPRRCRAAARRVSPAVPRDRGWPRMSPRSGGAARRATSRPSWSPTATAASSPRRPRQASTRCAICCWCPATCPRSGRASRRSAARSPPRSSTSTPNGGTFTVRPDALAETFLQDCDPEIQRQAADKTGPSEPGGARAAGAGGGLAAGGLDVPRLRRGPGHSRRTAARVRPTGRQRRRARRRPPPVPVPAGRGPRPAAEPVRSGGSACDWTPGSRLHRRESPRGEARPGRGRG